MKKLMIMALATLIGCNLLAQDKGIIDRINQKGLKAVEPKQMYWIKSNEMIAEYLGRVGNLTQSDLEIVSKMAEEEIAELDKILEVRDKIIGKEKKQSKIDKKLSKYFNDPQKAMETFLQTEEMKARAQATLGAVNSYKGRVYNTMPKNMLTSFHYSAGNGYAGWSFSVELNHNEDRVGGVLKYENKQMRFRKEDDPEPKPRIANVDDSVFVKVYNMIEEGKLYDEASYYHPFMDIMDGTGWSLRMGFGKEHISTGGYMAGPNHHEALNKILNYLNEVYKQIHPEEEEQKN
ncbi:MAG: hypothetical protein IJK74_03160 [Bacteroidales bacterium]|nr:hypothetical protein [Bacteroidales bacterium]